MIDLQRINQRFNDHCHNSEDKTSYEMPTIYVKWWGDTKKDAVLSYTVFRHDTWLVLRAHYGSEYKRREEGRKRKSWREGKREEEKDGGREIYQPHTRDFSSGAFGASLCNKGIVTSEPLNISLIHNTPWDRLHPPQFKDVNTRGNERGWITLQSHTLWAKTTPNSIYF